VLIRKSLLARVRLFQRIAVSSTMSALGQKQTCAVQKVMSALCQKRTLVACLCVVRFTPKCSDYIRAMGIRDRVNVDGDFGSKIGFTEYGRTSTKNFDVVL
jgi:hypothetical protein